MAEYGVSAITRGALINAAGELFAQQNPDSVPMRAIAELAGVKTALIHYHFGNREGLRRAVIKHVIEQWHENPVEQYLAENQHLFDTIDGRRQLVCDLIHLLYEAVYPKGNATGPNVLAMQAVYRNYSFRDEIMEAAIRPCLNAFLTTFRQITGKEDSDSAYCWFIAILTPALLLATNPDISRQISHSPQSGYAFYRRMEHTCIQNALNGVGLLPEGGGT